MRRMLFTFLQLWINNISLFICSSILKFIFTGQGVWPILVASELHCPNQFRIGVFDQPVASLLLVAPPEPHGGNIGWQLASAASWSLLAENKKESRGVDKLLYKVTTTTSSRRPLQISWSKCLSAPVQRRHQQRRQRSPVASDRQPMKRGWESAERLMSWWGSCWESAERHINDIPYWLLHFLYQLPIQHCYKQGSY